MTLAILGPGAVGGLLAALLHRAGADVVLIGREARGPLHVRSPRFGAFEADVAFTTRLADPTDALVVAVKAPALDAALERIAESPGVVVPLLNGVEHVAALRDRFGDRVVAGVVRVQAHRDGPTTIVHRAPFLEVTLAAPGAAGLAAALATAGVDVQVGGRDVDVLWGKLARLAALALATAAADAPLGDVRDLARLASAEVVAVGRAEGAALDPAAIAAELDGLPDAATSSLRADVVASRPTELDAIGGAVLRAAGRHAIACPTVETLVAEIAGRT